MSDFREIKLKYSITLIAVHFYYIFLKASSCFHLCGGHILSVGGKEAKAAKGTPLHKSRGLPFESLPQVHTFCLSLDAFKLQESNSNSLSLYFRIDAYCIGNLKSLFSNLRNKLPLYKFQNLLLATVFPL